jgi:NADH dehydrogenase [ubiquinone] 1 alpha subcomplex assembly factor 7
MTPIEERLRRRIELDGPVPLSTVMGEANAHYYATRDPLGAHGDFITAPEISQIFGELIGLWSAVMWAMMGRPESIALVELGPGRGTLMADVLRGLHVAPAFRNAVRVHLVETSPVLRAAQAQTLTPSGAQPTWHSRLEEVPDGPAIVLANEFFDALPVRHHVRGPAGWHERVVGITADGELGFGLTPFAASDEAVPQKLRDAAEGTIVETSPESTAIATRLGARLAAQGGAALIIDYGYDKTAPGETLQALKAHTFHNPLSALGDADLTAHVNFAALAVAARRGGAEAHGPVTQHDFLIQLGIVERLAALKQNATAEQATILQSGVDRLMQRGPTGMGALFKALALTAPGLPTPPGFAILMK